MKPQIKWDVGDIDLPELTDAINALVLRNVEAALIDAFEEASTFLYLENGVVFVWCSSPHEGLGCKIPLDQVAALGDDEPETAEAMALALEAMAAKIRGG
jgi:hypothetical protein